MISENHFKLNKDGTPRKCCICRYPELIENYEKAIKDTAQIWLCHHRLETHTSDGERRPIDLKMKELIALGMYWDRPPEELIFLTPSEHGILHQKGKSGFWKGKHHSEEHKRKISEFLRGHTVSEETKRKKSEALKGKHWKLVDEKRVLY